MYSEDWSDWADIQTDLSHRSAYNNFDGFCHGMVQIIICVDKIIIRVDEVIVLVYEKGIRVEETLWFQTIQIKWLTGASRGVGSWLVLFMGVGIYLWTYGTVSVKTHFQIYTRT